MGGAGRPDVTKALVLRRRACDFRLVDGFVKRAVAYSSGGQDVTTCIREFRESWADRAVSEGVAHGSRPWSTVS